MRMERYNCEQKYFSVLTFINVTDKVAVELDLTPEICTTPRAGLMIA